MAHNRSVEIRELRAFLAVVDAGGLSAAARQLHVSQSAISQTVQSLERQLGTTLLTRAHSGSHPTSQGELLAREARSLVEHHDRAVALLMSRGVEEIGLVRLGVPLELPNDVLPRTLSRLALDVPGLKVVLRHDPSAAQLTALAVGDLDVALTRALPGDPDYDAVLVVQESMGVILARDVAAEIETDGAIALHRLARLQWVGFPRTDTPTWHDQVSAILRAHGINAFMDHPGDRPVTVEIKLGAVAAGTAFGLAARSWAKPLPDGLGWYRLAGDPVVRRTWAVWRAASTSRHIAHLVEALELHEDSIA